MKIVWSKKLNSTAGRANWKCETVRTPPGEGGEGVKVTYKHVASVELAEKVIDDEGVCVLRVISQRYFVFRAYLDMRIKRRTNTSRPDQTDSQTSSHTNTAT